MAALKAEKYAVMTLSFCDRFAIVEKDVGHAEYDEHCHYVGKGLEHEMVDTGRPTRKFLGQSSFASASSAGDSSSRSLDVPGPEGEPPQEPEGRNGADKHWHLFRRKKNNKKHHEKAGYKRGHKQASG